jgi:hypothetical protein
MDALGCKSLLRRHLAPARRGRGMISLPPQIAPRGDPRGLPPSPGGWGAEGQPRNCTLVELPKKMESMSHNGATEHSGRPRAVEEITEEINQTHTKLLQLQTELNTALNAQKVSIHRQTKLHPFGSDLSLIYFFVSICIPRFIRKRRTHYRWMTTFVMGARWSSRKLDYQACNFHILLISPPKNSSTHSSSC